MTRNRLLLALYLLFIFFLGLYTLKKPEYDWDLLGYMGVVTGYQHSDAKVVHDTVYALAKQKLPVEVYARLTDGGIPYRKKMFENAAEFQQQMPFYTVKPLYTWLAYLFYRSGIPLIRALFLPSFLGYILVGLLLIHWLRKHLPLFLAIVISLLMMISPPMWNIGRYSTPDCLSTFILLAAMYCILEKRSLWIAVGLLMLSVFARLDNAVPAFFMLSLLAFSNKWAKPIPVKQYLLLVLGVAVCYLFVTLNASGYGWDGFYYSSLLKSSNLSHAVQHEFHWKDYTSMAISQLMTGIFYSNLFLSISLAMLVFIGKRPFRWKELDFDQLFVGVILLCIVVRFVLQPIVSDRYYAAYYVCILLLLVRRLSGMVSGIGGE